MYFFCIKIDMPGQFRKFLKSKYDWKFKKKIEIADN